MTPRALPLRLVLALLLAGTAVSTVRAVEPVHAAGEAHGRTGGDGSAHHASGHAEDGDGHAGERVRAAAEAARSQAVAPGDDGDAARAEHAGGASDHPAAGHGAPAHGRAPSAAQSDAVSGDTEPSHGEDHAEANTPHDAGRAAHVDNEGESEGDDLHAAASDAHAEDADHDAAEDDGDEEHHAAPAWATERGPQPYEMIRSLQYLQDQVARGNGAAIRVQARLLKWFGPALLRQPPETWNDGRNVRAAALFVLSGGPPAPVRALLGAQAFGESDQTLVEGALAYAENRLAEAEDKLGAIDLQFEEAVFASQVNLALAQLRQDRDPKDALERLERVMLEAPGTLLDEAALRLGVLLADTMGETVKADRYARQYFDRYAASTYAGNFRARFSAVYSARAGIETAQTIEQLDDALRLLPDPQRLAMYLSVGRRSLVAGNLPLAASTAERALGFETAEPEDRQRALLYQVAATLSERPVGDVQATLAAIEDDKLHEADKALKAAVLGVEEAIRAPIQNVDPSLAAEAPAVGDAVLARATSLLEAVDSDLKSLQP